MRLNKEMREMEEKTYRCNHCGVAVIGWSPLNGETCGYCGEGVFVEENNPLAEKGDRITNHTHWTDSVRENLKAKAEKKDYCRWIDDELHFCKEFKKSMPKDKNRNTLVEDLKDGAAATCPFCGEILDYPENTVIESMANEYMSGLYFWEAPSIDEFKDAVRGAYIDGLSTDVPEDGEEEKTPTHEEIMSLWWLSGNKWVKVTGYRYDPNGTCSYCIYSAPDCGTWASVEYFTKLKSATTPPEKLSCQN
jgi:DNA-directed RNA polymerase subunit RPC12/RpoP